MRDPAARDFLISGRQLLFRATIADADRAIGCFEQALRLQPDSAVAHAYLASGLAGRNHYAPDAAKLERAEREARRAIQLAPELADAHRALAGVLYQQGDLAAAEQAQLDAAEMGGTEERIASFMGMTYIAHGDPMKALRWLDLAQHFATLPGDYDTLIGNCWLMLLEEGKAEAAYQRAIQLRPEIPDGWVGLTQLRVRQEKFEAARQLCREYRGRFASFPDPESDAAEVEALIEFVARNYAAAEKLYQQVIETRVARKMDAGSAQSALARLLQLRGEAESARRVLLAARSQTAEVIRRADLPATRHYEAAALAACLGERETALNEFAAAAAIGWRDVRLAELDPRFDTIRSDPRFQRTVEELRGRIAQMRQELGAAAPAEQ